MPAPQRRSCLVLSINLIHCGNEFRNSVPTQVQTQGQGVAGVEVTLVRQGQEPADFSAGLFHGWCPWHTHGRRSFRDPWAERLARRGEAGELTGDLILGRVVSSP